jgi:putative flippase GtrA
MIKFGLVGVLNTAIGWGTFFVLFHFFSFNYVLANTIGNILGFINSFFWNKFWTFKSKDLRYEEMFLFILVFLICLAVQSGILIVFKEVFKWNVYLSQIISMVIYTLLNFIGNKWFTFRKAKA